MPQLHGFEMTFRGQRCRIVGFIEPADRSVGIMGDTFVWDEILPLDNSPPIDIETVTDEESQALDSRFWEIFSSDEAWSAGAFEDINNILPHYR